ncbi:MAG: FtsW/RodA/SpoVE family cell cycle protein [Lachnospiraceae bacterium]|nr:FtsW/RodA/SpoVE family cell cycle protein [Lachnospiraceae bacterium]
MRVYLSEIARVGVALFMLIYAVLSFLVFLYRTERKRSGFYAAQIVLMIGVQALLFMQMTLKTQDLRYLFFFAFQAVVVFSTIMMYRLIYPDANRLIVNNMCLLLMISMAILTRLSGNQAIRQFIIAVASLLVALILPTVVYRLQILADLTWVYAAVGIGALMVVLILGRAVNGSNLNYSLFGLTFQPSEFIKVLFVFFLAASLAKAEHLTQIFLTGIIAAVHVLILVLSRDLGAGLIYFVAFFLMLYIARDRAGYLFAGLFMGAGACVTAYRLFAHVRTRVAAWQDPWSAIEGAGYQVAQSLFGISVGGPFGLGLYGGKPSSIPFAEQDFIFSAIAEELGIVFAVSMLMVCLSTFLMILWISERLRHPFYRLLSAGFGIIYIFQVFLTVGGGTKFIPLTGVTLPLVSYGGSSVLSTILMFGILQGIVLIRAEEHREAVERLTERKSRTEKEECAQEGVSASEETAHPKTRSRYLFTPIHVTEGIFIFLFFVMSIYLCRYAYTNRQVMMSNSFNSRQKILLEQNSRGTIYARDGEVLAMSSVDENGREQRVYPYGSTFAQAVGFATKGKSGIEAQENYYLIRSDISLAEKARLSDAGETKNPGNNVTATLSVPLQEVACRALSAWRGAIVVTDVRTGEILAMVSKPDFDPNEIDEIWDTIRLNTEDSKLLNRVSQGLYPPGSTFKMVTALEYIRENRDQVKNYRFQCNGSYTNDGETIHCFHGVNHGSLDFYTSFQKSCNSSFANIGVMCDRKAFAETLKRLLFNEELPLDFPYNKSRAELTDSTAAGDVMQLSIGQGATAISPLHLNMITQAVANGGVMIKPYLVKSVDSADGKNLVSEKPGEEIGRVMSREEAAVLTEMMELVVNGGTAKRLEDAPYQAAGKTGSAEFDSSQKTESHAWFTGFAPVTDPEIAVTVIMEQAGGGGEYAVPMAKRIFDAWFEAEDAGSTD